MMWRIFVIFIYLLIIQGCSFRKNYEDEGGLNLLLPIESFGTDSSPDSDSLYVRIGRSPRSRELGTLDLNANRMNVIIDKDEYAAILYYFLQTRKSPLYLSLIGRDINDAQIQAINVLFSSDMKNIKCEINISNDMQNVYDVNGKLVEEANLITFNINNRFFGLEEIDDQIYYNGVKHANIKFGLSIKYDSLFGLLAKLEGKFKSFSLEIVQ